MRFITSTSVFGIGLDAYLILIILGLPVYFILRWVFKKFIHANRTRTAITWLATIILTPVIYVSIFMLWFNVDTSYQKLDFDRTMWMNDKDERYELSDNIIKSKMLIGKTKAEIRRLLGAEGNMNNSAIWTYILGFKSEVGFPDNDVLEIDFRNNKVTNVQQFKE